MARNMRGLIAYNLMRHVDAEHPDGGLVHDGKVQQECDICYWTVVAFDNNVYDIEEAGNAIVGDMREWLTVRKPLLTAQA